MDKARALVGIIGGSGVYQVEGLANPRWERVESPFGAPSDALLFGELGGQPVVFLPRHGRTHSVGPSQVNYRANIDVLKRVGVTDVVSVSAVGSLKESLAPGTFVVVDQFIDRTVGRERSFFGAGLVGHVSLAHPVCGRIGDAVMGAAADADVKAVRGGTYVVIEGPQFSTQAESHLFRSWDASVVGMTNLPEARLAREAELCYATVAMVTDYDCWHPDHGAVTVDEVVRVLKANAHNAGALVRAVVPRLAQHPAPCPHGCDRSLEYAIMTAPAGRDPAVVATLDAIAGRVLGGRGA
jgi:5'-methylthioadenosine phosphorylase